MYGEVPLWLESKLVFQKPPWNVTTLHSLYHANLYWETIWLEKPYFCWQKRLVFQDNTVKYLQVWAVPSVIVEIVQSIRTDCFRFESNHPLLRKLLISNVFAIHVTFFMNQLGKCKTSMKCFSQTVNSLLYVAHGSSERN